MDFVGRLIHGCWELLQSYLFCSGLSELWLGYYLRASFVAFGDDFDIGQGFFF